MVTFARAQCSAWRERPNCGRGAGELRARRVVEEADAAQDGGVPRGAARRERSTGGFDVEHARQVGSRKWRGLATLIAGGLLVVASAIGPASGMDDHTTLDAKPGIGSGSNVIELGSKPGIGSGSNVIRLGSKPGVGSGSNIVS